MSTSKGNGRKVGAARRTIWGALLLGASAVGCSASGGDVSSGEPIAETREALDIDTLAELRAITTTGTFRLTGNITMGPGDAPFVPIGSPFDPFRGTFNGNGFTINNLRIAGGWYTGLFGATDGATLTNIRLNNVNVSAGGMSGAIVGLMLNTTLTRSYVTGTVTGTDSGGGIVSGVGMAVGHARDGSRIERCYATGTVTGRTSTIGGFFGEIVTFGFDDQNQIGPVAKVYEVFTNVNVNPVIPSEPVNVIAGGLAGYVQGAWIQDINVVGPVRGRGYAGGVLGYVVNDNPYSAPTAFFHALSRANVTDAGGGDPAGVLGAATGGFIRCTAFYDFSVDIGNTFPTTDAYCNVGFFSSELKAPHVFPSPKLIQPFTNGMLVTQAMIDDDVNYGFEQCKLGSGSDGDWGFGTCGTLQTWALNSDQQHITLTRIPNPSVQPR